MRVVITGAAGFLGFHLVKKFLQMGHDVVGIDDLTGGQNFLSHKNYLFFKADCADFEKMESLFRITKPEVVYHAACYPHEGLSVVSPFLVTKSVTSGTNAVLSASVKSGVKKFIFCSTMARYGRQEQLPFTEEMTPMPVDPYGWAKFAAEGQIKAVCEAHGMAYTIVVPHNIYGPYQKYDDPFRNVAAIMVNRVLQGKPPIIYGDGTQKRCFSHVRDLIEPFYKLSDFDCANGEVINFGPDEDFIEINTLAKIIGEHTKTFFDPIFVPARPREVHHANCSAEKARKILGVEFRTSIFDGIGDLVEYIKGEGAREFVYHLPIEINSKSTPKTWTEKLI